MSIYDHLRDYPGLQFSAGPVGSYLYKNRLIRGSLDPAAGIVRDPAQERDWLIEQALNQVKNLPAGGGHTYWVPDVVGDGHEFYAELDEGYTQEDVDKLVYSFETYDRGKPTLLEAETQRTSQARARWLASQLAGKTPEEAYELIGKALTDATSVAQMRQVLTQLLPVIGAGLVYLARTLDK